MVTLLASASPQNERPDSSKRSLRDATRGAAKISMEGEAASAGLRMVV
jgi:hypothetical protein